MSVGEAGSRATPAPIAAAGFVQLTLSTSHFAANAIDAGAADPTAAAVDLEALESDLFATGALSVTLEDAADEPILEPAPGATPLWSAVRIKALFDPACDRAAIESVVRHHLGAASAATFETIADRVWEREWLKDFRPMRFGRRLWVCPGGQRPPQDADATSHSPLNALASSPVDSSAAASSSPSPLAVPTVEVELDPGLAFGTGTHPTTALCLEWLDGVALRGKTVIDYGCGSGILAIAALKLGARHAVGIDIDPQALLASRANAQRNGVADRLQLHDVATAEKAAWAPVDVVVANILAGPLEELAENLAARVHAGGHIVLSGLLESQAAAVAARYAPWFDMEPPMVRDQWARLVGVRAAIKFL